jgi:hypothetical protein
MKTYSPTLNIEDVLDLALQRMQSGSTKDSVLTEFSAHAQELSPLLEIGEVALNIPTNLAPTPLRQRKYAEKASFGWASQIFRWARFTAVPLALLMLVFGGQNLIQAMESSLPQDNLYPLKRTAEKIQVSFTRNSNKQANLQLELIQKRLHELQLASTNNNPSQEAAALEELKDQTQQTFATVPQIAAATALATKDSSLLDSLVEINQQQKAVVSAIMDKPQTETSGLATTALETAKKNGEALASLIATVQEQTLVDLEGKVSLTGLPHLSLDKKRLLVEQTTFIIDQDTVILSADGEATTVDKIQSQSPVNVVGNKNGDTVLAKIISLVDSGTTKPEVKGNETTTPSPTPPVNSIPKKNEPRLAPPTNQTSQPQNNPNEVSTGFIAEPPSGY